MKYINPYISRLEKNVYDKISDEINVSSIDRIVNENLQFHLSNIRSSSFQKYYFQTINNEMLFLNNSHFFQTFKYQYALQGIDNVFLAKLEENKSEILALIREDNLATLFFKYFHRVKLKHGKRFIEKDLGSFFAKLVHTFKPDRYCALDNPIKVYFGLLKESFFISFQIISKEYVDWAENNFEILEKIRMKLYQIDKYSLIDPEKLTDLKLLDLIFWSNANLKK